MLVRGSVTPVRGIARARLENVSEQSRPKAEPVPTPAIAPQRILATTSRMPFAVDEIRKLGERGHEVTATDTFALAPGSHTRGAARALVTPSPRQETTAFIGAVIDAIHRYDITWLLPMFEEVFYLAAYRDELAKARPDLELFFPSLSALQRVHDKIGFARLGRELGLPVADFRVVTSPEELHQAIALWEKWFAREAYGRGGLGIATNAGPLARELDLAAIVPTAKDQWIVQEYIEGVDRCSWSVVHHGEVVLHSCYEHPLAIDHRGGIAFRSVDSPQSLEVAQRVARELNWHGQISFDFLMTPDGTHHLVECNARPTAGCTVATAAELEKALFAPDGLVVVPPGRQRSLKLAVWRDIVRHPLKFRSDLAASRHSPGVYTSRGDYRPALFAALSLLHTAKYRRVMGRNADRNMLVASQFFDVLWDGDPIR